MYKISQNPNSMNTLYGSIELHYNLVFASNAADYFNIRDIIGTLATALAIKLTEKGFCFQFPTHLCVLKLLFVGQRGL